jgi:hypothetical protein
MRLLLVALMICAATTARADVDGDTAKRLFEEAVDDFSAGKFDTACPKLEASIRLRPEIKTSGMLAACYEKQGKLATAWRTFKDVRKKAEAANDNDTAVAAAGHVTRLDPKLARITIAAADKAGLTVTVNGKPTTDLDVPVEYDAGTYKIAATAGGKNFEKAVTIKDGDNERVDIPKLGDGGVGPIVGPKPTPGTPGESKSNRKLIGIGVLGGGVAIAAVGGLFGLQAKGRWDRAQDAGCNDDGDCPTQAGLDLIDQANSKGKLSTIFVGVGLAAIAGGVVLYLTAPKNVEKNGVALTVGGRGLVLLGRF